MNRKNSIGIGLIIILIIGGIFIWEHNNTHQITSTKPSNTSRKALPKEATIILTKNGFTPNKVTIKVCSAVRWKNESGGQQTVNSDNYPTNQLHKELNFGVFNNGSTVVYTFLKPGVYGFHNQFNHTQEGKIIVTK